MTYETDDWRGCYSDNWKSEITPDAFAHPAKFSRSLIRRIYEHTIAEGWLASGDSVIDPFGGVGLGAADAIRLGLHWSGVELEPRFCLLGNGNIAQWLDWYGPRMANCGSARLMQGDSRKLAEVVREVDACVSSPPYADQQVGTGGEGRTGWRGYTDHGGGTRANDAQLSAMPATDADFTAAISSPPYNKPFSQDHNGSKGGKRGTEPAEDGAFVKYGNTPGQLEGMSNDGFEAVISNPPYSDAKAHPSLGHPEKYGLVGGDIWNRATTGAKRGDERYSNDPENLGNLPDRGFDAAIGSPPFVDARQDTTASVKGKTAPTAHDPEAFGTSTGQLGGMKDAGFDLAVSSPPYVESLSSDDPEKRGGLFRDPKRKNDKTLTATYGESSGQLGAMAGEGFDAAVSSPPYEESRVQDYTIFEGGRVVDSAHEVPESTKGYGDSGIGRDRGLLAQETFWSAARQIVEQTHLVLKPGAHAIWVVKGYVRKGAYVDFPDQWRHLCEAVGFTTLHLHRCWLVERHGEQSRLDGGRDQIQTERKSFFRRLAEQKGSPRVDFEVVLCMAK